MLAGRGIGTLTMVMHGGGQERGLRPGTESVAQAAGVAAALARRVADSELAGTTSAIRDAFETALGARLPDVRFVSAEVARLPGHSLALIDGVRGDALCALLDDQGFAVAAGAACHSGAREPSSALAAMGVGRSDALGAVRCTFGEGNSAAEGERLATAIATLVPMLRAAGAAVRT